MPANERAADEVFLKMNCNRTQEHKKRFVRVRALIWPVRN
jgi:hypothetical protein